MASKATNIAGGSGYRIPYQSASDTTTFIDAPSVGDRFLQWTGSTFAWSPVTTDLSNLNASNLTSGTVPSARLSGTYTISVNGRASTAGNADTVTNGVYATQSYSNPGFISSLAYSKLTGAPSFAAVATSGSYNDLTNKPNIPASAVTSIATGNGLSGGTITSTGTLTMSGFYSGTFTATQLSGTTIYSSTTIQAGGNITAGGNVTAFSDRKLKDNLEKIGDALAKVRQITGYTYTRKDLDDKVKRHTGVIAQDVEVVLPEAVEEHDGIKGVAYGNMMGLVFEAIKELDDKLEEIKKQLNK